MSILAGPGYYAHGIGSGLGLSFDDLLSHVRKIEKRADAQEKTMAPLVNEAFALQVAAAQAAQQTVLQQQQLEQRGTQSTELMKFVPYVLGGLGVLTAIVLVIRSRRR